MKGEKMGDLGNRMKGINWNDCDPHLKRGIGLYKRKVIKGVYGKDDTMPSVERTEWYIDLTPPIFTKEREYIEQHLAREE